MTNGECRSIPGVPMKTATLEVRDYMDHNPVEEVEIEKVITGPPGILTPEDLSRLLNVDGGNLLPMIALAAFAGIRTAELLRLNWHDIDLVRGFVNVSATKSKTAQRRLIKVEPNLLAWLAPFAKKTGPLWTGKENDYQNAMTRREQAAGITMPHNCLRHSFASYHLAKFQDAARLSLDMGYTSPKLIFNTYREIVYPEAAERYFAIQPPTPPANLIPIAQFA